LGEIGVGFPIHHFRREAMRNIMRIAVLGTFVASMTGCISLPPKTHAVEVEPAARITKPSPGKALVYFIRTSKYGAIFPAPIFDNDHYIGSVALEYEQGLVVIEISKWNYLAYEVTPGKHMFTVHAQNIDFLPAELSAGKTYYVHIRAVPAAPEFMGAPKIRFYLTPQQGQLPQRELDEVLAQGGQLKPTLEGQLWVKENAADYQKTKAEWWQKYQAKPANERLELRPEHGR
jgi:hypothetical protein